ncbi:XXYS1_4_G0017130.mRNA.1.CDS.1 [Saccharomyces cerevisiae]|nr:XXYS1_4_G0017130.mRNA.1.CDS.1 [Saccharomyces cerevisiae]
MGLDDEKNIRYNDIGIPKWNLYFYILILRLFLIPFYMFHYPITLSILTLQLPLTSMTASHNLCHHLYTVYDNKLII